LDLGTKEKMVICCAHPRRSWPYILVPTMGMILVLQEPTYPDSVLARHAKQEKTVIKRVTKMVNSLVKQLTGIEAELLLTHKDLNLLKSQMEVKNKLNMTKFELTDVVEVNTTSDEGMTFSNSRRTYCERTDCLVRSRGKVYLLVLGQRMTVLLDKMKQDATWQGVSDSYDLLQPLQPIKKITLKQLDNQYKSVIIMEQLKLLLAYRQDDGVTNVAYYNRFKTRVDVTEHIDVSFNNPVLWERKSQEIFNISYDLLSVAIKKDKDKEDVKQAFLAYLFFSNSNDEKHSQLKKTVANDHAKGDVETFPSSCHAALTLMNTFKPLVIKGTAPVAAHGHLPRSRKKLEHRLPAPSATVIRNTLLTRTVTTVASWDIHQDVVLRRRRARLRRIWRRTSWSHVTSLPRQSSP
jgi:hypothetical protein